MAAYLTISLGASPATAKPLLASTDPDVVRDAIRAILGKVDGSVLLDDNARAPREAVGR